MTRQFVDRVWACTRNRLFEVASHLSSRARSRDRPNLIALLFPAIHRAAGGSAIHRRYGRQDRSDVVHL